MQTEWCIGRALGDRAKSIIDHANHGIGYFILDQGRQGNQATCLYAFLRVVDGPTPESLTKVTDFAMIQKLNRKRDTRIGQAKKPTQIRPSSKTIEQVGMALGRRSNIPHRTLPTPPAAVDQALPVKDRD